jgi:hypothetical protein
MQRVCEVYGQLKVQNIQNKLYRVPVILKLEARHTVHFYKSIHKPAKCESYSSSYKTRSTCITTYAIVKDDELQGVPLNMESVTTASHSSSGK